MSWVQGTIESDDEVAESSDGEADFALDEWEDSRMQSKASAEEEEEEEGEAGSGDGSDGDDEDGDRVKAMPRTEERAQRAGERQRRQLQEDAAEEQRQESFFDAVLDGKDEGLIFAQLNLSRALLRAVEAAGYSTPTPVQAKVIPLALEGRDVCASAVTGSGKTAAFVLPFLERLLFRPKDVAAIRVLVVTPTRELATQIFSVLLRLSMFTDITSALVCGGRKDVKSQEATLRNRPDVVVATPGRLIDHLRNSQSVSLDELDVLVLDEVDRLLELGFQDELEELLRYCPAGRQTMLFSATMTAKVEDLAKLSLRRPVRVKTGGGPTSVAPRLVQEFVKVRREDEREALVLALVCRSFAERTIVFCETKSEAHRLTALLRLMGVEAAELHGDVAQTERYLALQRFRDGLAAVLVATDVAARGLDIPLVRTVVNAEMPRSASTYIHRVGRTARAGCAGRSITLVSDGRRGVMKRVLKGDGAVLSESGQVLSRTVHGSVLEEFTNKVSSLEEKLRQSLREERRDKEMDAAEREAERAENLLRFEEEISARPARTWHQSEGQKRAVKAATKEAALAETGVEKEVARVSVEERGRRMALSDDYGEREERASHPVSRLKRRRQEALAASVEGDAGDKEMAEAKRAKKTLQKGDQAKREKESDRALGEFKKKGPGKVRRPRIALGGLDAEVYGGADVFKGRKSSRPKETLADIKEFDPLKRLRKGGKPGKGAFKSKGKFKRR